MKTGEAPKPKKRNVDPTTARLRAQKAARARWAKHDPKDDLKDVRAGRRLRLRLHVLDEARAHGRSLTWEEIARRSKSLELAHMADMAQKSRTRRATSPKTL